MADADPIGELVSEDPSDSQGAQPTVLRPELVSSSGAKSALPSLI